MPVTDENIIREFLEGNDGVFAGLYHRYKQAVYEYSLKMLGDTDEAGDIVQGVFLKAWERRDQLRQPARFPSWLMAITRNDCLSLLRKRKSSAEFPDDVPDKDCVTAADRVDSDDTIKIVADALRKLTPDLREVIILREYQDFSYRDIAVIIGVDEDIVRSRLFSARRKLHEMLKAFFIERDGI